MANLRCGHDTGALRRQRDGSDKCSACEVGAPVSQRCYARNPIGGRCSVYGEHQFITNTKGQRAVSHENSGAIWSTPVSNLIVVTS